MVMMGAPGGGAFAGPSATQSSASAGLPFAGVPSEMEQGASRILANEPQHPEPVLPFRRIAERTTRLTLRSLFENRLGAALWGSVSTKPFVGFQAIKVGPVQQHVNPGC